MIWYRSRILEGDIPVALNIGKLREATPRILERYHITADRFFE